jgi:hypothetical protein
MSGGLGGALAARNGKVGRCQEGIYWFRFGEFKCAEPFDCDGLTSKVYSLADLREASS